MAAFLGDIGTRARGLRTHLLRSEDIERLARQPTLFALQTELGALGVAGPDTPATASSLETAVRRHAATQLAVLNRWSDGPRRSTLAIVFQAEDHRTIQAMVRGAEEGASAEARLSGLIATRDLPERALGLLAAQPTVSDVVDLLGRWRHPLASFMHGPANAPHPSLFEVEMALHRGFARLARQHAARGGPHLVSHVCHIIDLWNAWAALLHGSGQETESASAVFIEGGAVLSRATFTELMALGELARVEDRLATVFRPTPFGGAFQRSAGRLPELEVALLDAQVAWHNRVLRTDPSGPAPILGFSLELRAQVVRLHRIIWGIAMRAPAPMLVASSGAS